MSFPLNIAKFLKPPISKNCERLLLYVFMPVSEKSNQSLTLYFCHNQMTYASCSRQKQLFASVARNRCS